MKNLFFVSVTFCIFSGTSYQAAAQNSIRFIDRVQIMHERAPQESNYTPEINIPASGNVDNTLTEKCRSLQFKYAQLTDQDVEMVKNLSLYSVIDDWYSVRYRLGGNSKKGIDCSSFSARLLDAVYAKCLPRTAREQYAASERIAQDELMEGDLVFFNTRGGISHVGVYLHNGYFVHAGSSTGVVISNLSDPYFASRYRGAGRVPSFVDYAKSNQ